MNNDLISRSELKKAIEQGEGFSWDSLGKDDLCVRKKYIDNSPTVELFCAYLSDGEVRQPCLEAPCKHERPQGEKQYEIKVNIPDDIKERLIHDLQDPKFFDSRRIIFDEVKSTNDCIIAYGDGFESARRLYERPSAGWTEFKYGLYYCSNCFDKVDKDIDRIEHLVAKRDLSPFCPFCGSLMKEKGEDND